MEQSIVTIIIVAVVFIVAAQYLQTTQNSQLGIGGGGPLATGSSDSAIQNPQPISERRGMTSRAVSSRQSSYSQTQNRDAKTSEKTAQPKSGYSRYESTVTIARVQRSIDPAKEYVTVRNGSFFNRTEASVSLNGWTIESRKGGRIKIPDAEEVPMIDTNTQPIVFAPGGETIITSGATTFGRSFRENSCTDYFSQNHSFSPSLASCSAIPFNAQELLDAGYNSECVDFIQGVARCRIPAIPYEKSGRIGNACIEYITDTYSYTGCVGRFRDSEDFFKKTWRVFLNQPSHIFDILHDRVILRDSEGLIVDEFEY